MDNNNNTNNKAIIKATSIGLALGIVTTFVILSLTSRTYCKPGMDGDGETCVQYQKPPSWGKKTNVIWHQKCPTQPPESCP